MDILTKILLKNNEYNIECTLYNIAPEIFNYILLTTFHRNKTSSEVFCIIWNVYLINHI